MSKTALLGGLPRLREGGRGHRRDGQLGDRRARPTRAGSRGSCAQLVGDELPWDEAQREFMRKHRPQSLIQRLIEPEEIANMVTYLARRWRRRPPARAVRVDGGYVDSIIP